MVDELGNDPRLVPRHRLYRPATLLTRLLIHGPSTWNQTTIQRSSGACLIIRRYWNKVVWIIRPGRMGPITAQPLGPAVTPCLLHHTSGCCSWCPQGDLNSQALRRLLLRQVCLPFHHKGISCEVFPSVITFLLFGIRETQAWYAQQDLNLHLPPLPFSTFVASGVMGVLV